MRLENIVLRIYNWLINYKNQLISVMKWLVFLFSVVYLVLLFVQFSANDAFIDELQVVSTSNLFYLFIVFLLLPLNWALETLKWKKIVSVKQDVSFFKSLRAVLAGASTAFFSPNRTGEFVGRAMYIETQNRPFLIPFALLNSVSQNVILLACGLPSVLIYVFLAGGNTIVSFEQILTVFSILLLVLFFAIFFINVVRKRKLPAVIKQMLDAFYQYNIKQVVSILFYSFLRYLVFSIQFYFILRFFNVDLGFLEAIIGIPTNYFLVTLIPAFSFSEAGVRGAMAVAILGFYAENLTGIAFAGIGVWLINFVLPMFLGAILMLLYKSTKGVALN